MANNISLTTGNLLAAEVEALVNTVNSVGVMGKGIALQFKQAFPENYAAYVTACKRGEVEPGRMFVTETGLVTQLGLVTGPRYIINFPTKDHWRAKSKMEDIESGLAALTAEVKNRNIHSLAVPPLGCGNGGLDWNEVRPRIESAFAALPAVHVLLFSPDGAPASDAIKVATRTPNMTPARAMIIGLLDRYALPGYRVGLLETQKLVYFLQVAGEPLQLAFTAGQFGPYVEALNHVLERMDGHFLRGYGDRSRKAEMQIMPGAVTAANQFLQTRPETQARMERVFTLIDGYETPYGLELLATLHWLAQSDPAVRQSPDAAIAAVRGWSPRKSRLFSEDHIRLAWHHLHQQGWI